MIAIHAVGELANEEDDFDQGGPAAVIVGP